MEIDKGQVPNLPLRRLKNQLLEKALRIGVIAAGAIAGMSGGAFVGAIAYVVLTFFAVLRKGLNNTSNEPEAIIALVICTSLGCISGAWFGWKRFAPDVANPPQENCGAVNDD